MVESSDNDQTNQVQVHSKLRMLHSKFHNIRESGNLDFMTSDASSGHFMPKAYLNPKFNLYGKYGKRVKTSNAESALEPHVIDELNDHICDASIKGSQNFVLESQTQMFHSGLNS